MRLVLSLAAATVALAPPATAQLDVRSPVELQSLSLGDAPFVASSGELSVAVLRNAFDADLTLSSSDGRGVEWTSPVAVDPPDDGAWVNFQQAEVLGGKAYVLWADGRFQITTGPSAISRIPFLRIFDGATQTFGPELQIPTSSAPELSGSLGMALDVVATGAMPRLHVASIQTEPIGPSDDLARIVLHTSNDEGATWHQTVVTPDPSPNLEDLRIIAEGSRVDLFWIDGPAVFSTPILHARSMDGGLTFGAPAAIPGIAFNAEYAVDVEGDLIAAVGASLDFQTLVGTLQHTTSMDGGATWAPAQGVVTSPGLPIKDVKWPDIAIRPGTADVMLAFSGQDASTGGFHVLRMYSIDGGASWYPAIKVSTAAGYSPTILHAGDGRFRTVITWRETWGDGPLAARVSLNGGLSFAGDEPVLSPFVGQYTHAWNDHYQNLIIGRVELAAPKATSISGFRPQDLDLVGFTAGSTFVRVDFENMDSGADLALVLLSSATGDLPLPLDGRNTGLGDSPLLQSTLPLALSGVLTGSLVGNAGSTGSIPLPNGVPAGLTLHALGLGIDLDTGTFVDLTDVLRIDT